jgi:signal transduction histidine kinase
LARGEEILKRMSSLITDIIDFSKNKRVELVPARIDFNQIIMDAFEDSASLNGGKKINTNIEVDENKFVSDERCIRIILNNIISNAVKYSDANKEMPEIALHVSVLNNTAYIHLSDNGIGIEEHHIDKVFSIYYRATNTSSGSGLGLHLVKETVQKLNGSITLESQKNIGTKIEIVLPGLV